MAYYDPNRIRSCIEKLINRGYEITINPIEIKIKGEVEYSYTMRYGVKFALQECYDYVSCKTRRRLKDNAPQ